MVSLADVVKTSDEDLHWLYPGSPPRSIAREWQRLCAGLVIVTEGASGAYAVGATFEVGTPGVNVSVADTVGAGDSFMGAVICEMRDQRLWGADRREALRRLDVDRVRRMLRLGVEVAAVTVSRAGANPPTRAEI